MAIPALGPSFFCAPAGRCRCTSIVASGIRSGSCACLLVMPRSYACVLTQLSASSALSLITYMATTKLKRRLFREKREGENAHHQVTR